MARRGSGAPHRSSSRPVKRVGRTPGLRELRALERDGLPQTHLTPVLARPSPPARHDNPPPCTPDGVFVHAAAIFHRLCREKDPAHRLISYGRRSEVNGPEVKDAVSRRMAYELAFSTLKYQELLEDMMIDSCFYQSQPVADDLMSLVAVMLYDFLDRKFLPREQPANHREEEEEEEEPAVRQVEQSLLRFKTKLAAALARWRIKREILTIECVLPERVRQSQERASHLPIYTWVNTFKSSMEEVCDVLGRAGFSRVKSIRRLEGQTYCQDPHCPDLLVFPNCVRREIYKTNLLSDYRLIIQDKACCVGPWALRPLLDRGGDVLIAGSFSASTVAHVAGVVHANRHTHTLTHSAKHTHGGARVFVCLGEGSGDQTEMQDVLSSMGCSNVKLLPRALHELDVCNVHLQRIQVILLTPQCSLSAVCNPVEYLLQENGDTDLLQDLSQGTVSQSRLQTLVSHQRRDLQHALHFSKVQAVVYSTCSSFPEENDDVVKTALSLQEKDATKLQPFRLSSPSLLQSLTCEEEEGKGEMKTVFFRLEASDQSNGCFLAVLTRQPEPEVKETPQEVLARAAAKGLLDGIQSTQTGRKEGRGRKTRSQGGSAHIWPRPPLSDQSLVEEFLKREARTSSSTPPLLQERMPKGKARPTNQLPSKPTLSSPGPVPGPAHTPSLPFKSLNRTLVNAATTINRRAPLPVAPPTAPPKGRQEVLRRVTLSLPPVLFPSLPHSSVWMSQTPPLTGSKRVLSYLQSINSTTHTHSQSSGRVTHPRPWL